MQGHLLRIRVLLAALALTACEAEEAAPAASRGAPRPASAPPSLPPTGPRIRQPRLVTEVPFVGEEGVDEQGFPTRMPDKVALLHLARAGKFELLEEAFERYQKAFEDDWHHEDWPIAAGDAFEVADPTITRRLDEWVAASPDSWAPYFARGHHRMSIGSSIRGGGWSHQVSDAKFRGKAAADAEAWKDWQKALELHPRLEAARRDQLRLAIFAGADMKTKRELYDAAIAACPGCYRPRFAYMYGLLPRWGGSHEAMRAFAKENAKARLEDPRIAALAGMEHWDRANLLGHDEKWEEALAANEKARAVGNLPLYAVQQSRYLRQLGRLDEAEKVLGARLARSPQDVAALKQRYLVRNKQKAIAGAAADMLLIRGLGSWPEMGVKCAKWLHYEGDQLRKAGDLLAAHELYRLGVQVDPNNRHLVQAHAWNAKNIGPEKLLAMLPDHPDDFYRHLDADHSLAASRRFDEVVTMWNGYIERHPTEARAFVERGGAKWQLGQLEAGIGDMRLACDNGSQYACQQIPIMKKRLPQG